MKHINNIQCGLNVITLESHSASRIWFIMPLIQRF